MITVKMTEHEFNLIMNALYNESTNAEKESKNWKKLGSSGMAKLFENDITIYNNLMMRLKTSAYGLCAEEARV